MTGFADGGATFTFSRHGKRNIDLYFGLKLPNRDRPMLEAVQAFLGGIGRIYPVRSRSSDYYRVSRPEELHRVVEHFDQYPLQSAKRETYVVWREMVLLKLGFGREALERLGDLAKRLSARTAGST